MLRRIGNDIAENLLLSASPARALEDPDIAGLARGVVPVDHGEIRREAQCLVLSERIHSPVMENRVERHCGARSPLIGDVFSGKRKDFLFFGEAMAGLADISKAPEILI